ncbi:MAG: RDD family protein [Woeseiaceae bacterium]|nr:RDD family protein [Woeseiaceae bacterium]
MFAMFADNPQRRALRESRAGAARLFADFGVRIFVLWLDLMLLVAAGHLVTTRLLAGTGFSRDGVAVLLLLLSPLYFALSWISPLRATPLQFLFGMRVVDVHGNRLGLPRAVLRSLVLIAMLASTLVWFDVGSRSVAVALAMAGCISALLAALTPNRQGAHDLVAASIVVNKRMLRSEKDWQHLEEIASRNDSAARRAKRPTVPRMLVHAAAVAIAVFVTVNVAMLSRDKDLRAGAYHALNAVSPLRIAVAEFYRANDRWPDGDDDVGTDRRGDYPDGGYFELQDEGHIEIHFTESPELVRGHFELVPDDGESGIEWTCRVHGDIHRRYQPSICRL